MQKFKQFLTLREFVALTDEALQSHMDKPEVIQIMRALSTKWSDLGDQKKALSQIGRAEQLAKELLGESEEHEQYIYLWLTKVEIILKSLRAVQEEESKEAIAVAKKAMDVAKKIFGEKTFITNQAMLTYAMTLTKDQSKLVESTKLFEKAERLFTVINNEISFKEGCNLMFNMLLHYNLMLNDFGTSISEEKRQSLVRQLQTQAEVGGKNVLIKRVLVAIKQFFVEPDP